MTGEPASRTFNEGSLLLGQNTPQSPRDKLDIPSALDP
jgi:hypothetical protein